MILTSLQFYFVDNDTVSSKLGIEWYRGNPDDGQGGDERCVEALAIFDLGMNVSINPGDWGLNDRPCSTPSSHYVCQIPGLLIANAY